VPAQRLGAVALRPNAAVLLLTVAAHLSFSPVKLQPKDLSLEEL
jgi:hypothetical protein